MKKLVFGVGVNDVDYVVQQFKTISYVDGKQKLKSIWTCPYYMRWYEMIRRSYSKNYQAKYPTYINCSVDPDWLYLSNFIKWVDSQPNKDWQNCHLDKDILVDGNKQYGPSTCIFIERRVNLFITDRSAKRGKHLLGVSWHKSNGKFVAQCRNPFNIKGFHIGVFNTELEAHKAWQAKKHEYACQLADLQDDPRVAKALRERYAPDKDWTII